MPGLKLSVDRCTMRGHAPLFLAQWWNIPIHQITATLVKAGVRAHTMNQTLSHALTGCNGHPSGADNIEIAASVGPAMAAVLGW